MGNYYDRTRNADTTTEVLLGLGFLLVAAAVVFARQNPPSGYEQSIYSSTPLIVWGLIAVALVTAVSIAMYRNTKQAVTLGLALGGTTMTIITALPIIRGYYFFGGADSLTHLGWTKDLASGEVDPASLFYPAYHSISLCLSRLLGISPEHALMFAMVILFVPFLVFVPLTAWIMTGDTRATAIAGIASWMVMPVNNVATHMVPHTNTLALFFAPVLLFVAVAYFHQSSERDGLTPIGGLLAILSAGYVILHAQHAVNLLLVFGAICGVQFVIRRYRSDHPIAKHRPLYAPTMVLATFVFIWMGTHETATRAAQTTFDNLLQGDVGAVSEVTQRTSSLLTIGAGITEIFLKLFLVSALFALLTGGYLYFSGLRNGEDVGRFNYTTYLIVALVPLTVLFGVYFMGTPKMAFRQYGFIFVLITIISGVAGTWLLGRTESLTAVARPMMAIILVACLLVSLTTVFASPFIHKPTPAVSEQSMAGYQTTFDHRVTDVPIATLNDDPTRFSDGIYGVSGTSPGGIVGEGDGTVATDAFNTGDFPSGYPTDSYYLALPASDVQTQLEVYRQLNYEQVGLEALQSSANADRVVSNGEYRLYLISDESGS